MSDYSKQAHDIADRNYTRIAYFSESDDCYIATCQEFDGCHSHGDTSEEALVNLDDAMLLWIQCLLEDGLPIPEPSVKVETANGITSYHWLVDFMRTVF